MKEYYNSYSRHISLINISHAIRQKLFFSILCVQIVFIYDIWTGGFFSNQSKWLCAWDIPVHCSVFWSYWSEIMINNFLHHVLHLFYQFTYNSIFFQIENFATIAKNYASLSRSNYGKIIQRKRLKTVPTLIFTRLMTSQFLYNISAKYLVSF